ncbi:MAG: hypothetical protein ABIR77_04700 [Sphingomicrobium sp.]
MSRALSLAVLPPLLGAALLLAPMRAIASHGAAGFNLVNNSGQALSNLFIRRTGTQSWLPLPAVPPKPAKGLRATSAFADPDCAFDIKATLEDGKEAVWAGVNLCEVKSLTLNRNDAGMTWADYD